MGFEQTGNGQFQKLASHLANTREESQKLIKAIVSHDYEKVRKMIFQGFHVNGDGCGYGSPISCAVRQGEEPRACDIVRQLIEADPSILTNRTPHRMTPLHEVCSSKNGLHIAKILLRAGADVHAVDIYHKTPLHYCLENATFRWDLSSDREQNDQIELIKMLIQEGADVDEVDIRGNSPRSIALRGLIGKGNVVYEDSVHCDQKIKDIMLFIHEKHYFDHLPWLTSDGTPPGLNDPNSI